MKIFFNYFHFHIHLCFGSIFPNPWKLIRKSNDLNAIQIDLILAAFLLLLMTMFLLFIILEHINTAISEFFEWKSTAFLYTMTIHAILHGFDALLLPLNMPMPIFVLGEYLAADDIVVVFEFYHLIL